MTTMRGSCDQPLAVEARRTARKPKKVDRRAARTKKPTQAGAQVLKRPVAEAVQAADVPRQVGQQAGPINTPVDTFPPQVSQIGFVEHPQAPTAVSEVTPATVSEPERAAEAPVEAGVGNEQQQSSNRQGAVSPPAQTATAQHDTAPTASSDRQVGSTPEAAVQPKNRVLIIEDDPIMRMLLKRGLSNFDFECLLTENGRAAQEILQKDHPDVLLVDLLMPVMDGLAFIKWLRHTAHDSTPVVVFTTVDNPKVKEEVLGSGADFFASKPLHVRELADTMRNLIARKRANQ